MRSNGSVWVMGEWSVGQLIVGVIHELSENVGLHGLTHHIVEISGDVTEAGQQTITREDSATQLVICETLALKSG